VPKRPIFQSPLLATVCDSQITLELNIMGSTFVCCLSRRERLQCLLFRKLNPRFCVSSRLGLLSLYLFLS
jgi:hypothetical protein